ncbi:PEP-CTERM sorting domain-containing protein [Nostoc sp.]|uniref:PEP-CTERM sorting domain-containing protein n=1 Tax=Nostoc sp. TaxID=1180 RepID=UPI002FFAD892
MFKGLATIALVAITFSVANTPTLAVSLIGDNLGSNSPLSGSEGISDNTQPGVYLTLLTSDNYNNFGAVPGLNNYFPETNSIVETVNSTPTSIVSFRENINVSNGFTFTNSTPSFDIDVTQASEPTLLNEPNTLPGLFLLTGFALLLCRKNTKDDDKLM